MQTLLSSILAGVCISIGGTAFLLIENKYIAALVFAVGLFIIRTFHFSLYTGHVGNIFDTDGSARDIAVIWFGNLIGTIIAGGLLLTTNISPALVEKASAISLIKEQDTLLSLFVLGMFCNVLIYFAVHGNLFAVFFGIPVFVLCGFEHSVADMFYFTVAGMWSDPRAWMCVFAVSAGNAAGGILFHISIKTIGKSYGGVAESGLWQRS